MSKNKKKKFKQTVGYVVGSLAFGAAASILIPKYLKYGSSYIYDLQKKIDKYKRK